MVFMSSPFMAESRSRKILALFHGMPEQQRLKKEKHGMVRKVGPQFFFRQLGKIADKHEKIGDAHAERRTFHEKFPHLLSVPFSPVVIEDDGDDEEKMTCPGLISSSHMSAMYLSSWRAHVGIGFRDADDGKCISPSYTSSRSLFALFDCNNFFASCERIFRPDLEGSLLWCSRTTTAALLQEAGRQRRSAFPWGNPSSGSGPF